MPVIAYNLLQEIEILTNTLVVLNENCIKDITADIEHSRKYSEESVGIATILSPILGYYKTSKIVQKSLKTGKSIRNILLEENIFNYEQINDFFSLEKRTYPGILRVNKKTIKNI